MGRHYAINQRDKAAHLIACGLTNEEIADQMCLSLHGAKYHVRQLLSLTGLQHRSHLIVRLIADGWQDKEVF